MSDVLNVVYIRPMLNFGPLEPEYVRLIKAVDPCIRFLDAAELAEAENRGDPEAHKKMDAVLSDMQVMFGFPPPPDLLSRAPELKWIQMPLAGVDIFLTPEFITSPVLLTNGKGIGIRVAETAMMHILMLAKLMPVFDGYRKQKRWKKEVPLLLENMTLGILGLGVIGSEIAHLAKAFHMQVIATEIRKEKQSDREIVDRFLPAERLPELLAQSDFVLSALPLNRDTTRIIGKTELEMMKPTAYFINISRGAIVDEPALIRALKDKRIAGAGLDVYENEPLPPDSPLWDMPNVIMTPHIAGLRSDYDLLATRLFCKNLKRFLNGEELINLIDKERGF